MYTRILIPLDGSALAERALEPAIDLAQANGAELILLRIPVMKEMLVHDDGTYGFLWPNQSVERCRQEAIDYLGRVEQTTLPRTVAVRRLVIDGDEAGTIVDTAASEKVDLIVMSTHGRSGLQRWFLGSVTEKVLRAAPCPVFVVRHHKTISKVLIPLDGSELAEQALAPGLGIANSLEAEVVLLRVNEELVDVDERFVKQLERVEQGLGAQYQSDHYHLADSYLENVTRHIHRSDVKVQTTVVDGPVAQSILNYAESEEIGLIVMATHGRTGLQRWVYGSVAEKVLRAAPCAVMIVRPPSHQLHGGTGAHAR